LGEKRQGEKRQGEKRRGEKRRARRAQLGRLYELPLLGAILVVVGAWLAKYHPAGWLLAAAPILVWLGIIVAGFVWRVRTRLRRGRAVRARLAALQAEGFSAQLVCKGDLARGEAWAAFDPAADAVKLVGEEATRGFALSRLGAVTIDEPHRLGDPTPLYYVLSLYFGDPNAPFQAGLCASIATTRRREAERWKKAIDALMGPRRPPSPTAAA
jgi:hypothetical protein